MNIVLAGCSGFIGKFLLTKLRADGHVLTLLTRKKSLSDLSDIQQLTWDGIQLGDWKQAFEKADVIVNLSGANIAAKRWSPIRKTEIIESRVKSTRAIVNAMQSFDKPNQLLINASAVGFYGPVLDGDVTESSPLGKGFLAEVCNAWENETVEANKSGARVVQLRIGVVLERGGGAIQKMELPFKLFAGGPLGNGKQWFPWIHRSDIANIIQYIIQNPDISGPVNATAPNPVTMKEFSAAFGKTIHRPSWAPVPSLALKILLGEMSEMLLTGQKAVPKKLTDHGFQFQYPTIDSALQAIY